MGASGAVRAGLGGDWRGEGLMAHLPPVTLYKGEILPPHPTLGESVRWEKVTLSGKELEAYWERQRQLKAQRVRVERDRPEDSLEGLIHPLDRYVDCASRDCGNTFMPTKHRRKYCSTECRVQEERCRKGYEIEVVNGTRFRHYADGTNK